MPTYPANRRFFRDDEFRNENAATAAVVRALARSQNYRYSHDLKITPSDAKVFGGLAWPWATSALAAAPVGYFGPTGFASGNLARFVVSAPRAPAAKVRVILSLLPFTTASTVAEFIVKNRTNGDSATVPATCSGVTIPLFVEASLRASPGDTIQVSCRWVSGGHFRYLGLSAWWDPDSTSVTGATFDAGWSAISQSFHSDYKPMPAYTMRWLGRMSNASVYERPQMVAASATGNPGSGTSGYYATPDSAVGYTLHVGGQVPSVTVTIRARIPAGTHTVDVVRNSSVLGTVSLSAGVPGVAQGSTTITLTPGPASVQYWSLVLSSSTTFCEIEHVLIYENTGTASSLGLPAGETVPTSFDANLDERLSSGMPIRADDIARLVANEVWLWAYRRDRVLVNDCLYTYKETRCDPFTGAGGITNCAAVHQHRTSKFNAADAARRGQFLVRAGYHQAVGQGSPMSWQDIRFQVGQTAASDTPGSPAIGAGVQYPEGPRISWESFGLESHQHACGTVPSGETTRLLESVYDFSAVDVTIGKTTRPCWLTTEELPLDTPTLAYP